MTLLSSFIFCETTLKQINDLPENLRLKFYEAVTNYGIYNIEPHFTGLENTIWISMKDIIDTTKAKRKVKQKAGQAGGEAKRDRAKNKRAKQAVAEDSNPKQGVASASTAKQGVAEDSNPYQALPNGNGNGNENVNENENEKQRLSDSQKTANELAELLLTSHRKEFPDFLSGKKEKDIQKKLDGWSNDIEKLIRLDKKPPENIRLVILWVKTKGNFWFPNIISGKKLREKYETVWAQMQSRGSTHNHRIGADNVSQEFGELSEGTVDISALYKQFGLTGSEPEKRRKLIELRDKGEVSF
jgi:hypothetical protein